jgi:hypothetical protein
MTRIVSAADRSIAIQTQFRSFYLVINNLPETKDIKCVSCRDGYKLLAIDGVRDWPVGN